MLQETLILDIYNTVSIYTISMFLDTEWQIMMKYLEKDFTTASEGFFSSLKNRGKKNEFQP